MAVLDHHGIVEHGHVGHAAVGMAGVEIVAEQRILFRGWLRRGDRADEVGVDPAHAALGVVGLEVVNQHPDRHAATAVLAGRTIGDRLRAAEAGLGQHVVERGGALADQMGENLALHHARQIGAGRRGRQVELRRVPHFARQAMLSRLVVRIKLVRNDLRGNGAQVIFLFKACASAPPGDDHARQDVVQEALV